MFVGTSVGRHRPIRVSAGQDTVEVAYAISLANDFNLHIELGLLGQRNPHEIDVHQIAFDGVQLQISDLYWR